MSVALKWREYPNATSPDDREWIEAVARIEASGVDLRYALNLRSSDLRAFLESIREWRADRIAAATFSPLEPSIRLDLVWSADRTHVLVHVTARRVLSGPDPAVALEFVAETAAVASLEMQLMTALQAYPPQG